MNPRLIFPTLLLALGAIAYHNSFFGEFIFDDIASIPENPYIEQPWPLTNLFRAPSTSTVEGRPTVALSLALNHALGGKSVTGYHAFNLVIHLANALLLFYLVNAMLLHRRTPEISARRIAFAVAALWVAHPLQTEAVSYIIQRTELLMAMFLLLLLHAVRLAVITPSERGWPVFAVVWCVLGMGSKEVMVVAPLLAMAFDRIFFAENFCDMWKRRRWMYAGLAASWILLIFTVSRATRPSTSFHVSSVSWWDYLMTESGVLLHYLRLTVWPSPLVVDYYDWPIARSLGEILPQGLMVLGLLTATGWALARRPAAGFLGLCFFLILAPTSSILPSVGEAAAERRMYLPLAAVLITVVMAVDAGLQKAKIESAMQWRFGRAIFSAVVIALTAATIRRNEDYRSALVLWQDTVNKRPQNARAHANLGTILGERELLDKAVREYHEAIRFDPRLATAHLGLGIALRRQGKLNESRASLTEALRLAPTAPVAAEAHLSLAITLSSLGQLEDVGHHFREAVRKNPDSSTAKNNLAIFEKKHAKPSASPPR